MSETRMPSGIVEYYNGWRDITPTNDNVYEFVTQSYKGSGGYVDGSYLNIFDKESNLDRRKRLVYYKNYIKGIVDSLIVPVFSDEAMRETDNDLFEAFLNNVDNKGHNLQEFTKIIVKFARIHGVCFSVMDNFSVEAIPDTQQEAINQRKYPYIYYRTADEVYSYSTNEFDSLNTIAFNDGHIVDNEGKKIKVYRLWTEDYSVRFINKDGNEIEISERIYHELGFLPIIATYIDIESGVLPHPPIYDLCRMNYTVYNMDSEQRNLERLCAFPTLTLQTKGHDINMNIGADSLITYGSEYDVNIGEPSWISPSDAILKVINDLSNEVVQKLVEASNVLGATAINTGNSAKSGVALSYEFLGQSYALKQTARIAENYEKMVAIMFGLFVNTPIDYYVHYNDNYQPSQDELTKKLNVIERLIDLNISDVVTAELKKELIKDVASYYKFRADSMDLVQSIATMDTL